VREDQERFENAVRKTGVRPGEEPIMELSQRYQGSLNALAAASETGFTEAEFLRILGASPRLRQAGLATLASGGAVKRDAWEDSFGEIAASLGLGVHIMPTRLFGERFFTAAEKSPVPVAPSSTRTLNAAGQLPVIEFVRLAPGTFQMGCSAGDSQCDDDERLPHPVRITREFEMGKYEVTQAEWQSVMGNNPSSFKGANHPVENVSWNDVRDFLVRLNSLDRRYRYRLPTEAEWEFAARAGAVELAREDREPLDALARYADNSSRQTGRVGEKRPNAWGLYDMLGNVEEWVQDNYSSFYASNPLADPAGPQTGSAAKVLRGGSWSDPARNLRVSRRDALSPTRRDSQVGFRLVREAR
jgi:formylglycine-generating enzyme required for sulfatase activity